MERSPTLRELTPSLYPWLNPLERALAEKYFASYMRKLEKGEPARHAGTPQGAAQMSYTYALYGTFIPLGLAGAAGLILVSMTAGRPATWISGIGLLVLAVVGVAVVMRRGTYVNKYFRGNQP